jgi:hypothetical protein
MATDVKQIARRFMDECWNQGKLESIGELVSDDCRIHDPVFPSLASGADNLKRHIGMCRNGFPDLTFWREERLIDRPCSRNRNKTNVACR